MVFFKRIRPPSTKMSKPILSCHPITTKDWLHIDLSLKMNDKNTCFCHCCCFCSSNIYDVYIAEYFYVLIPKMDIVCIYTFSFKQSKKRIFFVSLLIIRFIQFQANFLFIKNIHFFSHYTYSFFFLKSSWTSIFKRLQFFYGIKQKDTVNLLAEFLWVM